MTKKSISMAITSEITNVALLGHAIKAICEESGLDASQSFRVHTSVVEAVNNSILHAYQGDPSNRVKIECVVTENTIEIQVSDEGVTMESLPKYEAPAADSESGRGWWIMRQWMDEVSYRSKGGINTTILKIYK